MDKKIRPSDIDKYVYEKLKEKGYLEVFNF